MKRVLITGAAGFVGANLARRMLELGHETHVVIRGDQSLWRLDGVRSDLHLHDLDVTDREGVNGAIASVRPEWIFHLAVHGAYSHQTDPFAITQTNVLGTMNLVEACRRTGFEVFVNTGTSSEYGFKDHAPVEDEAVEPNSYYSLTKCAETMFCRFTARKYGLRIPTLRLYSAYGPWEEPTRLMPTVITRGLAGTLPPLVNPAIARDYVAMDDVLDAYLLAADVETEEKGAVFNVATGVQTTLREVVETARNVLSIRAEPSWGSMPDRAWDTDVWVGDSRKIQSVLGWRPRVSFEEGFRRMVEWFVAHPEVHAHYAR